MSDSQSSGDRWDIQAARAMYNIDRWGAKYFDIDEDGHVVARPLQENGIAVDINDVVEEAKARGLRFPLLIRFQDILRHRVEALNTAIEFTVDLLSPEPHFLAGWAKDVAAGAVFVASVGAVVVGCLVFGPHLWVG